MSVLRVLRDKEGIFWMDAVAEFRQEMILVPLIRMFQGQTVVLSTVTFSLCAVTSWVCAVPHKLCSGGALVAGFAAMGSMAEHLPIPSLVMLY